MSVSDSRGNGPDNRARARTREEIIDMALAVHDAAEGAEKHYTNKHGEDFVQACPDFKAQLGALRLIAELQGMLKTQPDDGAGTAENVWPRVSKQVERLKEKRS